MERHISIGKLCRLIGVSLSTAYRWIKAGTLVPAFQTSGGHRRFDIGQIETQFLGRSDRKLTVATYARVSSADQKSDLETQTLKLQSYVAKEFPSAAAIHITDLGSGLNYKKKGLSQLLKLIWTRQIDVLVLNHKDRLLRFGAELVFMLCSFCKVEIVIVEAGKAEVTFEQELARDVIELMTVFCARLYGKRSHKNKCGTSG